MSLKRAPPHWEEAHGPVEPFQPGGKPKGSGGWIQRLGLRRRRAQQRSTADMAGEGRLLIICAREECSGPARLLQQQLGERLKCDVVIGANPGRQSTTWLGEVESATRGVVLLQTKSVLLQPVRLMQLYEATVKGHPLVCVSVVGGGYDFGTAKRLLLDLEAELPQVEMMA